MTAAVTTTAATRNAMTQGHAVVVGLGRTGMSVARHLHERGISFAVTDSRSSPPELDALRNLAPQTRVSVGGFDVSLLDGASQLLLSPGVSQREPIVREARSAGVHVIGDIELFAQQAKAPIVAITGTNGKSTVTTLVALMAEAAGRKVLAGGNLGRPALDLLDEAVPDLYVLELSSYQLETTASLHTAAACVLNVTPDHMDRYDTIADYAATKARIFDRAAVAVVNDDDPIVRAMPRPGQRTLTFGLKNSDKVDYRLLPHASDLTIARRGRALISMAEMKITGTHNAANAMAALAMCEALELPLDRCLQALRTFTGLPHRSQWVAEVAGVRYIDDSKGTNAGATLAAVEGLQGLLVLIAGGQGKGQDFAPLAPAFRGKVRHVVLIGQDAALIEHALNGVCTMQRATSMEQAVQLAASAALPGETVLLSPACASLDMFRDYAHRGDSFAQAVRRLA